jgi:hypothetical protein
MTRRSRSSGFKTQPPREVTLIIAAILWLVGFASEILHAVALPAGYGDWALVVAGGLLILGSLFDRI